MGERHELPIFVPCTITIISSDLNVEPETPTPYSAAKLSVTKPAAYVDILLVGDGSDDASAAKSLIIERRIVWKDTTLAKVQDEVTKQADSLKNYSMHGS